MKLHYMGKFDLNPDSLPHGEHKPGAVKFKEPEDSKSLAIVVNVIAVIIYLMTVLTYISSKALQITQTTMS